MMSKEKKKDGEGKKVTLKVNGMKMGVKVKDLLKKKEVKDDGKSNN